MAEIDKLFHHLKKNEGSDLHLVAGLPPRIRRFGSLQDIDSVAPLTAEAVGAMMREIVSDGQWKDYSRSGDLDFAYGLKGVARFRANFLRQHRGPAAVFRLIPERVKSIEELDLPPALSNLADLDRGLVLVTGPTGSGKSTTLAAIIDRLNSKYAKHIITIENPVEFVHP
ncbi:MAG: ATPase, T2SS/T4P/T4SS family, partial [Acidobacteriota bacterium]|nr:ATPase, T2SS/T4P/T4SS family [Acidobacteriota bacterium]